MNAPTDRVMSIRLADFENMRDAAARCAPEEACGLLAGKIEGNHFQVVEALPITNILHSPVRYRMDPAEQLRAFEYMDAAGLTLVGIYHSHPQGPRGPSPTDLAEAYYPEAVYLIWCGQDGEWECRAFRLQNGQASPVEMRVIV